MIKSSLKSSCLYYYKKNKKFNTFIGQNCTLELFIYGYIQVVNTFGPLTSPKRKIFEKRYSKLTKCITKILVKYITRKTYRSDTLIPHYKRIYYNLINLLSVSPKTITFNKIQNLILLNNNNDFANKQYPKDYIADKKELFKLFNNRWIFFKLSPIIKLIIRFLHDDEKLMINDLNIVRIINNQHDINFMSDILDNYDPKKQLKYESLVQDNYQQILFKARKYIARRYILEKENKNLISYYMSTDLKNDIDNKVISYLLHVYVENCRDPKDIVKQIETFVEIAFKGNKPKDVIVGLMNIYQVENFDEKFASRLHRSIHFYKEGCNGRYKNLLKSHIGTMKHDWEMMCDLMKKLYLKKMHPKIFLDEKSYLLVESSEDKISESESELEKATKCFTNFPREIKNLLREENVKYLCRKNNNLNAKYFLKKNVNEKFKKAYSLNKYGLIVDEYHYEEEYPKESNFVPRFNTRKYFNALYSDIRIDFKNDVTLTKTHGLYQLYGHDANFVLIFDPGELTNEKLIELQQKYHIDEFSLVNIEEYRNANYMLLFCKYITDDYIKLESFAITPNAFRDYPLYAIEKYGREFKEDVATAESFVHLDSFEDAYVYSKGIQYDATRAELLSKRIAEATKIHDECLKEAKNDKERNKEAQQYWSYINSLRKQFAFEKWKKENIRFTMIMKKQIWKGYKSGLQEMRQTIKKYDATYNDAKKKSELIYIQNHEPANMTSIIGAIELLPKKDMPRYCIYASFKSQLLHPGIQSMMITAMKNYSVEPFKVLESKIINGVPIDYRLVDKQAMMYLSSKKIVYGVDKKAGFGIHELIEYLERSKFMKINNDRLANAAAAYQKIISTEALYIRKYQTMHRIVYQNSKLGGINEYFYEKENYMRYDQQILLKYGINIDYADIYYCPMTIPDAAVELLIANNEHIMKDVNSKSTLRNLIENGSHDRYNTIMRLLHARFGTTINLHHAVEYLIKGKRAKTFGAVPCSLMYKLLTKDTDAKSFVNLMWAPNEAKIFCSMANKTVESYHDKYPMMDLEKDGAFAFMKRDKCPEFRKLILDKFVKLCRPGSKLYLSFRDSRRFNRATRKVEMKHYYADFLKFIKIYQDKGVFEHKIIPIKFMTEVFICERELTQLKFTTTKPKLNEEVMLIITLKDKTKLKDAHHELNIHEEEEKQRKLNEQRLQVKRRAEMIRTQMNLNKNSLANKLKDPEYMKKLDKKLDLKQKQKKEEITKEMRKKYAKMSEDDLLKLMKDFSVVTRWHIYRNYFRDQIESDDVLNFAMHNKKFVLPMLRNIKPINPNGIKAAFSEHILYRKRNFRHKKEILEDCNFSDLPYNFAMQLVNRYCVGVNENCVKDKLLNLFKHIKENYLPIVPIHVRTWYELVRWINEMHAKKRTNYYLSLDHLNKYRTIMYEAVTQSDQDGTNVINLCTKFMKKEIITPKKKLTKRQQRILELKKKEGQISSNEAPKVTVRRRTKPKTVAQPNKIEIKKRIQKAEEVAEKFKNVELEVVKKDEITKPTTKKKKKKKNQKKKVRTLDEQIKIDKKNKEDRKQKQKIEEKEQKETSKLILAQKFNEQLLEQKRKDIRRRIIKERNIDMLQPKKTMKFDAESIDDWINTPVVNKSWVEQTEQHKQMQESFKKEIDELVEIELKKDIEFENKESTSNSNQHPAEPQIQSPIEPQPKPKTQNQPKPEAKPKPEVKPEVKPEAKAEVKPEVKPQIEPKPQESEKPKFVVRRRKKPETQQNQTTTKPPESAAGATLEKTKKTKTKKTKTKTKTKKTKKKKTKKKKKKKTPEEINKRIAKKALKLIRENPQIIIPDHISSRRIEHKILDTDGEIKRIMYLRFCVLSNGEIEIYFGAKKIEGEEFDKYYDLYSHISLGRVANYIYEQIRKK